MLAKDEVTAEAVDGPNPRNKNVCKLWSNGWVSVDDEEEREDRGVRKQFDI